MCGRHALIAIVILPLAAFAAGAGGRSSSGDWPVYGGDAHGTRYSPADRITRENVARLRVAWRYSTRESEAEFKTRNEPILESTPLVAEGTLYLSTPLGRVIALDPGTGAERWVFDAGINRQGSYGDFTNRGVALWRDANAGPEAPCGRRVYLATIDARLVAIDAARGRACEGFGERGVIDLRRGLRVPPFEFAAYQVTSPPLVFGDLVIVGSAIADNSRLAPASGEVRAFDARTGALRWTWDPIPQDVKDPAYPTWEGGSAAKTGAANVWSIMVADPERGLLFAPTSSPAPDYYGALRLGSNRDANSIVALRAATGEVAWAFQTVHHDLWDYDNASPPALVTIERGGRRVPAVLQATKTGQLFVLHRETGEPLFPVEERPVPTSDIPGEKAWPTQPFTAGIAPLSPHRIRPEDAWGVTPADRRACRELIGSLRNEGIFTPPSLQGTLVLPSNIGGAHWGGVAVDPVRQIAVVPVNRVAAMVQLLPGDGFDRKRAEEESDRLKLGYEYNRLVGTPYAMRRRLLMSPSGVPCTPPPFGALVAIDLRTGARKWEVPLGTTPAVRSAARETTIEGEGALNLGGAIVTAGGLVFIAATGDRMFRALDVETGARLWEAELPAPGRAAPMTYVVDGKQYVAITAGGGGTFGSGDYLVVFGR